MSRSYKHTPRCGDRKSRYYKRYANRCVRRWKRSECFPPYAGYRKMSERWNICDYEIVGVTFTQFYMNEIKWSVRDQLPPPDIQTCKNQYQKFYIRK